MQISAVRQMAKFLPSRLWPQSRALGRHLSTKQTTLHLDAIYMARSLNLVELSQHVSRKWLVRISSILCDPTKLLRARRPEGTYTCKVERDWAFFWIDHTSYHSHHARVDAEPAFPALMAVSRRGSLVRVNADGSSPDHDMEAAVQQAVIAPLPVGTKRPHEGMLQLFSSKEYF